ncbi:DNA cytosine methyltransferase [Paenibacillus sp. NRS-1760]|uniref:DNA cytosine methyltransferase n=1 Tax=Paenibacillus sp. NRS-1760 TaxID=3233902 RepID=UPI003D28BFAE
MKRADERFAGNKAMRKYYRKVACFTYHRHSYSTDEIFVDNFAGGGGASTGIEVAIGRSVDEAINHDPAAIAMHKANHPETRHWCESVWDVDPRAITAGRPVALVWLSPDCKHFSKAKGSKPVEKSIRGLAWVGVRWAATVRPRVIMLENVEEFKTWGPIIPKRDPETGRMLKLIRSDDDDDQILVSEPGEIVPFDQRIMIPDPNQKGRTFNSFVNALRRLGYVVEWRELRACDYGAPTIRKRLFLIARCDGQPIVWPEPTHGAPDSAEVLAGERQPWKTAASDVIDWSIPCPSIFTRKKELADNTKRRIARGLMKFVINSPDPFIVKVNHQGDLFRGQSIDEPLQTMTSKNGYGLVTPYIARIGQTGFGGDRMQYGLNEPLTTIVTKAEHLLVVPHITKFRGGATGHSIDEPLHTITSGAGSERPAGAAHAMGMVTAFLAQYHTETSGSSVRGQEIEQPLLTQDTSNRFAIVTSNLVKLRGTNIGQPVTEPLHTVTAGGLHHAEVRAFLIAYYGASVGQSLDDPLQTVVTKDRFGLVTIHGVDYQIVDIGMRMLEPHELYAAQGFPRNYIIKNYEVNGKPVTKSDQVARCGNSVSPPIPAALVNANLPEHCAGSGNALKFERYAETEGQLQLTM